MKTNSKKNNRFLKLAAALMILCLITTCAISTTFAKYATTNSTEDTARVAKWGVVLSASGTLFGKNYATNRATDSDAIIAASTTQSADTHSVVADAKVVAPGTKNDVGVLLKLNGQPEVAYSVSASTDDTKNKDIFLKAGTYGVMVVAEGLNAETVVAGVYYVLNGTSYELATEEYDDSETYYKLLDKVVLANDYYPVVWSLSKDGGAATEYSTVKELTDAIMSDVNGTTDDGVGNITINTEKVYDANIELDDTYQITWAWDIENNNGADTILGNIGYTTVVELGDDGATYAVISNDSYILNIAFDITISAEQVD